MKFLALKPISYTLANIRPSRWRVFGVFVNFQFEIFYQQCCIECGGGGVCGIMFDFRFRSNVREKS